MQRRQRAVGWRQMLPGIGRVLGRFVPYLRQHKGLLAGAGAALMAATLFRILEPWPLKFVIDRVVVTEPGGTGSGIAWIDSLPPMTLLTLCAAGLVATLGLRALMTYLSTVGFALAGNRVLTAVRRDLFRHLQRLSPSFHDRARSGDLTLRVVGDVGLLKEATVTAILPLLANGLVLAAMIGVMMWLNWQLALVAFLPLPLLWLATVRIGRRLQTVSREQRAREGAMAAATAESMGAIRLVQAFSLEDRLGKAFDAQNGKSLTEGVRAKRLAAGLERGVDVLIAFAMALVLWYGAVLVLRGALTPGDLIVFLTYLKNSFRPIRDHAKYTARFAKATAAGERIVDILEIEPEIRDRPDARAAPRLLGAVRFENVSFAYPGRGGRLEGIDLALAPGERVALVGPSGAGKSTLAAMPLRFYDPQAGRILLDGMDIRDLTLESVRGQIGIVLQDNLLIAGSVRDNIALAVEDATQAEVETAARLANAHDFIVRLADGYATPIGERGATLSAGQRQRIAIARAILRDNPILVLDEPTTGLDRRSEDAVIEALLRATRGRTTLLVTHDLELAAEMDRVIVLAAGRIVESGPAAPLLAAGGPFASLWAAGGERRSAARMKERNGHAVAC